MKRRIAAIATALVIAVIGVAAVVTYANSANARALAGQKVTEVFIANKRVPEGTSVKAAVDRNLIAQTKVVAKGVPDGAMTKVTPHLEGQVALSDIPAGTVVLTAGFGAKTEVKKESGVPKGDVAVSLSLSDPAGIAPLIRSGSHIAIYDTFNSTTKSKPLSPYGAHLNDDKATTRGTAVVLADVEVLRVDGKPKADDTTTSESSSTMLVTVVVPPSQATRLVHAIQTGNLYAALLGEGAEVSPKSTSNDNTVVVH